MSYVRNTGVDTGFFLLGGVTPQQKHGHVYMFTFIGMINLTMVVNSNNNNEV